MEKLMSVLLRLMSKVKRTKDGCWQWKKCKKVYSNKPSYPNFMTDRTTKKIMLASRFSWQLFNGDIPTGILVCHKCDNSKCVNPDHLFLGTAKDNSQDCVKKNRCTRVQGFYKTKGEKHFNNKLKSAQVIEIRKLVKAGKSQNSVAKLFNVNQSCVSRIMSGKLWSHLP